MHQDRDSPVETPLTALYPVSFYVRLLLAFRSVVGLCCLREGLLGDLLTPALEGDLNIRVQIRVDHGVVLTLDSIVVVLRDCLWWTVKDNQEDSCEPSHASEYNDPHNDSNNQGQRPTTSLLGRLSIEWWLLSPLWLSIWGLTIRCLLRGRLLWLIRIVIQQ